MNLPIKTNRVNRITTIALIMAVITTSFLAFVWHVGAWNLLFKNNSHDTVPPELPTELRDPAVLIFSKTNSFRHKDGIAGGQNTLGNIAQENMWGYFATENGAVFNDLDLARFKVVVFLNATGDMLDVTQEQAFQRWLKSGGGWLGIHAAGDGSHKEWAWYQEHLLGADFTAHILGPQFQNATVTTEDLNHPVTAGMDSNWEKEEEWYSWEKSPRAKGLHVLATLDESTYSPVQNFFGKKRNLRMGDHPILWSNCIGNGRSVYTAIGHRGEAFEAPQVRLFLTNALGWLIDGSGGGCPNR